MNIPENILQQVADAAFNQPIEHRLTARTYHLDWISQSTSRRAVIQHALDNPALAPYLNVPQAWPPVGEYSDSDIAVARNMTSRNIVEDKSFPSMKWLRAFIDALPRRESPALADPEPAAQVPLGPEDMKPGAIVTNSANSWYKVKYVTAGGVRIDIQGSNLIDYEELKTNGWSINTSLPDTGRWDANAWRDCSKPGKEVAR